MKETEYHYPKHLPAVNPHTGKAMVTGVNSSEYQEGWERIFGNKSGKVESEQDSRESSGNESGDVAS